MNTSTLSNEKQKYPLWSVFLFSFLLIVLLISLSAYVLEKWSNKTSEPTNTSELVLQQEFILGQEDAINTNWLRTLDPLVKNVEGRIVWSNALQKGMMEFVALPKLSDNQKYQLWIYDLIGNDTKPILSVEFADTSTEKTLIPISSNIIIKSPFKFELLLKTVGEESSQPLLLAQP